MSLDDRRETEQLAGLAAELTEAGEIARAASARSETPDAAFAAELRSRLMSELAGARPAPMAAALLAGSLPDAMPVPPDRPLAVPENLAGRRGLHGAAAAGRRERTVMAGQGPLGSASSAAGDEGGASTPDAGKRWRARQVQPISTTRPHVLPAVEPTDLAPAPADHVAALRPSVRWRMSTHILPARWVAVGLAATIAMASFLYGSTLLFPMRPQATADVAVAATVVRGGVSSPLVQGAQLLEGDEIEVGAGGQATLAIGASFVRMAPGSDVRLDGLDANQVVVDQLGGRAYYRAAATGAYTVVTGSVNWVAAGTAFDLDLQPTAAGGEEACGLALLDGLNLQGPKVQVSLSQGQSATVELAAGGSAEGQPVVTQISAQVLADSWLVENAQLDALAGLALGELAVDVGPTSSPSQTPLPAVAPTAAPTVAPVSAPTAAPTRIPTPTPVPTRKPTPKPTAKPTPAGPASLGKLTIVDNGDGTYTFSWPEYKGDGFTYYKLVYGDWGTKPNYPDSPFWACNDSRDETTWTGPVDVGDYAVRVQVVDESKGIVIRAQTGIVHLNATQPAPTDPPVQSLGTLGVADDGGSNYTFTWSAYTGGFSFDAYKLVWVAWDGSPSYLDGDCYVAFGTDTTSSGPTEMPSGDWSVRVQAIGSFAGNTVVFGQTGISHVTVP